MTSPQQPVSPAPNASLLKQLYDEQSGLLQRLSIHERNLQELLRQKALHGIDLPLATFNGIKNEEQEIANVTQALDEVNIKITKLTRIPPLSSPVNPGLTLNINSVDYQIEAPYPYKGSRTAIQPNGQMCTTSQYVGGFDIKATITSDKGMQIDFYRHGRQISPNIDDSNAKIILPLGVSFIVGQVKLNTRKIETISDILPETIAEGCWTVLAPSMPRDTITTCDWPQGQKDFIMTTQILYESGQELWIIKAIDDSPVRLWFYLDNWNVAPVIDKEHLCLRFPNSARH